MTLVAATTKASHPLIIMYGQVELRLQAYLTSVLDGGERSLPWRKPPLVDGEEAG